MTEQGELFPELLPAGAVAAPQHEAASVLLEGLPDKATCTVPEAAAFLAGKPAGMYDMKDLLAGR